jgi:hypothetical protein
MDFFIYLPIRQDFLLVFTKGYGEASNNGNFSHTEDFFNLTILGTDFLKVIRQRVASNCITV